MNRLPAAWQTDRLLLQDSQLAEVGRLREIFNACTETVGPWDATFRPESEATFVELVNKGLEIEPSAKSSFQMQSILWPEAKTVVGYYHLTHCHPRPYVAFVSMFVLHPDFQGQQLGQEVVRELAVQLKQNGRKAIWLDVYLKNWPALRFWFNNGFTHIIDYDGDKVHTPHGHAWLVLEKRLD